MLEDCHDEEQDDQQEGDGGGDKVPKGFCQSKGVGGNVPCMDL